MTTETLAELPVQTERRQFQRKKFNVKVEMEWGFAVLAGTVRDIGPRGIFVEMTAPLWLGAAFRARLILNPVLPIHCTVVRVEPGAGIAAVYEVQEQGDKSRLEEILLSLPPL